MSDRELLELAAKAIGIHIAQGSQMAIDGKIWNPLIDDGNALRLAVKLHLIFCSHNEESWAQFYLSTEEGWATFKEPHAGNECAATRRAIVRAAAEIGKHSAPSDSGREG